MHMSRLAVALSAFALSGCAGVLEELSSNIPGPSEVRAGHELSGQRDPAALSLPALRGEEGLVRDPGILTCGEDIACVDGWDLWIVSVDVPGEYLPAGEDVVAEVIIQNRGNEPSEVSEVMICEPSTGWNRSECGQSYGVVALPSVSPGETVRVRHAIGLPQAEGEIQVLAVIDPDKITSETFRDNNEGVSAPARTELPGLQWLSLDVGGPYTRSGPITVTFEVRNSS